MPSVLLVLQGGPGTLATVHSALVGDNPVPVVIVKSSGGTADILVYALTRRKEIMESNANGEEHQGLVACIKTKLPDITEQKMKDAYDKTLECLNFEDMVRHNFMS